MSRKIYDYDSISITEYYDEDYGKCYTIIDNYNAFVAKIKIEHIDYFLDTLKDKTKIARCRERSEVNSTNLCDKLLYGNWLKISRIEKIISAIEIAFVDNYISTKNITKDKLTDKSINYLLHLYKVVQERKGKKHEKSSSRKKRRSSNS